MESRASLGKLIPLSRALETESDRESLTSPQITRARRWMNLGVEEGERRVGVFAGPEEPFESP